MIKRKDLKHTKKGINSQRQQERKKGTKQLQNNHKTMDKMAMIYPYLPVITVNVNGLNFPIKRHRQETRPNYMLLLEIHFKF